MSSTEENIKDFKTRTCQGGCRRTIGELRESHRRLLSGGQEISVIGLRPYGLSFPFPPSLQDLL